MTYAKARAIVLRQRVVGAFALLLLLPIVFIVTYFLPRTYSGSASVLLTNQRTDASNELTTVLTSLAKSSAILERVRASTHDAVSIAKLQQNVKARLYGTILKITYTDSQPALAIAVPNDVVDSLVTYYNNLTSSQYDSSTARLQAELVRKQRQLHDLDGRFQALSASGIPVDAENPAGSAELASSLAGLQAQRIQAEDTLRSDLAYAGSRSGVIPTQKQDVSTNPEYASLASALQRDEALLTTQQAQYSESFPVLIETRGRVAKERSQLATLRARLVSTGSVSSVADVIATENNGRSSALISADHAKIDAIDAQIGALQSRSNKLLGSRVTIETLKAERESVVAQFNALSASLATALASRAIAANYGTLSVIDRAAYAEVAGLNGKIVIVIDVLVAFALAFGLCAIADRFDQRSVRFGQTVLSQQDRA